MSVSVGRTDPCRTLKCSHGQHCVLDKLGEARCECSIENECSKFADEPVCGTDWRDYSSVCHLKKMSCLSGRNIMIKYKGPCGKCWNLILYSYGKIVILILYSVIKQPPPNH